MQHYGFWNFLFQQSQLSHAINREDYEDAARLKVAIAAAATSDTVGGVISRLNVGNLLTILIKKIQVSLFV